jgi:hypothetical protein
MMKGEAPCNEKKKNYVERFHDCCQAEMEKLSHNHTALQVTWGIPIRNGAAALARLSCTPR